MVEQRGGTGGSQGVGFLIVQTRMGNSAFPVEGVRVTVSTQSEARTRPIRVLTTDSDGQTDRVFLPAPSARYSLFPGGDGQPVYYNYQILVEKPGFQTKHFLNVPIFEGQTSLQIVRMLPIPQNTEIPDDTVLTREPDTL